MSWQPPQYGVKGRENCWIAAILQGHDTFCGCDKPILHLMKKAIKEGGILGFNKEEAIKLLQCPTTLEDTKENGGHGTVATTPTGPEGDLQFGDLDKLFEEEDPFSNDDTG